MTAMEEKLHRLLLAGLCQWRSPLADIAASLCFGINDRPLSTRSRQPETSNPVIRADVSGRSY